MLLRCSKIAVFALLAASVGCGRDREAPKATEGAGAAVPGTPTSVAAPSGATGYAGDIDKLCNVVVLAKADQVPSGERALPIANWLAANLTTPESRQFLVKIQPLVGTAKADALDAEARRVGLTGCALAAEWRAPT